MISPIPAQVIRMRRRRGMPLDAPYRPRGRREVRLPPTFDALNAAAGRWRLPAGYLAPGVRTNLRAGL